MASSGDIRDIMDLGHNGPRQSAPKKKKKTIETMSRLSGISREVQALMGDSVPPVAIIEARKYKNKPSVSHKMHRVRHWEERPFTHGARKDNLVLRHWKRAVPGTVQRAPAVMSDSMDTEANDDDNAVTETMQFEDEYPSEKWNVEVPVPSYTNEHYEKHLHSEDWSREETDYLFELCRDHDLRWILIADRYDPSDIGRVKVEDADSQVARAFPPRNMEALKARYYTVSAKMLEIQIPASQMTNTEFNLWEKMRNFDARTETARKAMAEKLFERTKDEADEERVLLEELHRITRNEEDFIRIRKDLYTRLETAPSLRRNERGEEQSTALYQSSHGLSVLLSTLLAKERKLKRPVQNTADAASTAPTPTETKPRHGNSRRETIDSTAEEQTASKKGAASQPVIKSLSPAEEVKYGVSHPTERLTSGVTFRHEKINRITTAKSQVQTQKIQAALTELGIPPRLLMPTERVCREFERLVTEVQILLDARRTLEKVSSEVKVLEEHKRIRLGQRKVGSDQTNGVRAVDTEGSNTVNPHQNGTHYSEESTAEASALRNATERSEVKEATNVDDDDDDDAEDGANDQDDDADIGRSTVADNDEDEGEDGDEDAEEEEDEEEDDDDEDEDDRANVQLVDDDDEDDDAPGLEDLEKAHRVTDDEEEEDEDEEEDDKEDPEEDDGASDEEDRGLGSEAEEEDEHDQVGVEESIVNGTDEDEEDNIADRPNATKSHKRSASVLSDGSRTGSNRSGAGRKKRK